MPWNRSQISSRISECFPEILNFLDWEWLVSYCNRILQCWWGQYPYTRDKISKRIRGRGHKTWKFASDKHIVNCDANEHVFVCICGKKWFWWTHIRDLRNTYMPRSNWVDTMKKNVIDRILQGAYQIWNSQYFWNVNSILWFSVKTIFGAEFNRVQFPKKDILGGQCRLLRLRSWL